MHKLSIYLNDDQYTLLKELSDEADFESVEECANYILYSQLFAEYRKKYQEQMQDRSDNEEISIEAPTCPICGKPMHSLGSEGEKIYFECKPCDANALLSPDPKNPDDCVAEFSKDPLHVEVRRRWALDKPGFTLSVFIYTYGEAIGKEIVNRDQDDLTFDNMIELSKDALKAFLPLAERYTGKAVEASIEEFIKEIS